MGAWGTAAFDNDDASDWVYELETDGIAAVDAALTDALEATDLYGPTDVNAIAAAEVVSAARGRLVALANGLATSVTPDHAGRSRAAVERVLAGSELSELWAETDDDVQWRGLVGDLIQRLSA
jgi:hypothetical protein